MLCVDSVYKAYVHVPLLQVLLCRVPAPPLARAQAGVQEGGAQKTGGGSRDSSRDSRRCGAVTCCVYMSGLLAAAVKKGLCKPSQRAACIHAARTGCLRFMVSFPTFKVWCRRGSLRLDPAAAMATLGLRDRIMKLYTSCRGVTPHAFT